MSDNVLNELRALGSFDSRRSAPLWRGPCDNSDFGGVTNTLLARWLDDREKFRLYALEGLAPADRFNHRLEYGNMFHLCQESVSNHGEGAVWLQKLWNYAQHLCKTYPMEQDAIMRWYEVCRLQFPLYLDHWKKHPQERSAEPVFAEKILCESYKLPSGRTVWLRGKVDGLVRLMSQNGCYGGYVRELKTKGDVDVNKIQQQLRFDLQTMLYLTLLDASQDNSFWRRANKSWRDLDIRGVIYTVVRRPLSGGPHSTVKYKPSKKRPFGETTQEFYARVADKIRCNAEHFFHRWPVDIAKTDVLRFRNTFLDPCLEEMCDWYEWVTSGDPWRPGNRLHWRFPHGVNRPALEDALSAYDNHMDHGTRTGLHPIKTVFPELQPGSV